MVRKDISSNRKAVDELFRKHYKVLRAYAYRLVSDKDMAEDLVQDAYYELWKKQDDLIFDPAIRSYLFKSVYSKALNHLNSKANTQNEYLEQNTEEKIQHVYLQSLETDLEADFFARELETKIHTIVTSLPEQCRKVFILSRKYELKNKEIAERLGISVKAVEKHISKALAIFRNHLTGNLLLW